MDFDKKTEADYAWEAFRWESSKVRAKLVDSLGYVLVSYGNVEAARESLARHIAQQLADGIKPGELDYRTCHIRVID